MVVVISLDLQMLAKVLNALRAFPILASTSSSVHPVILITLPKYVKEGDWGDRHGVHTLRLTVQQNLDFSAKCLSRISTWLEKDCALKT